MSDGSGDGDAGLPDLDATNLLDEMWSSSMKEIADIDPSKSLVTNG